MKKMVILLGLGLLLSSCGGNSSGTPLSGGTGTSTGTTASDVLPAVARPALPSAAVCTPTSTGQAPLSDILFAPRMRDQGQRVHLALPLAVSGTVYDLLATTKADLNKYYYGYSTVKLDDVHAQNYNKFKVIFPNNLRIYNIASLSTTDAAQVDTLMNSYIDSIKDYHTFYMSAAETNTENTGGVAYPTFGVSLDLVPGGDGLLITDTRLGSPAQLAGLKRGDVILSINGTALARNGATDHDAATAFVKVLAAAAQSGKAATMTVSFAGQTRTVSLTAAVLQGTEMPWGEVRADASGKKHYYLRIPTFLSVEPELNSSDAPIAQKVHQLVAQAQAQGATDLIIDLRGDGGGYLHEFVGVAAAFAPSIAGETLQAIDGSSASYSYKGGNIMYSKNCTNSTTMATINSPSLWTGKVAVLVDGYSASASEMLSSNLQAAGFKVVGTQTYGIGSTATNHFDLPGGGSISITTSRAFVNGKALGQYVTPDVQVADDLTQLASTGVDNTLQAAYSSLK